MGQDNATPRGSALNRSALVFLVVGVLTVLVDLVVYRLLVGAGLEIHIAKAISFIAGTVFAYFANRVFTFRAEGGARVFARFAIVYGTTLACNIGVNALTLALLPTSRFELLLGFLAATFVSATMNFLGMRYFVFGASAKPAAVAPSPLVFLRHPDVIANAALGGFMLISAVLIQHFWKGLSVSDGIAQFMPMSLEGYRAVTSGALPLYNFIQFGGTPLLETGYYPVLSPVFLGAAFIAEAIFGAPQMTWNLLVFFQLSLNALAAYWFCRLVLRLDPIVSLAAGVATAFLGVVVFLSEWYYMACSAGFTLALLILVRNVAEGRRQVSPILLGVGAFLFLLSSNVQFLFYAGHFLALGWVAYIVGAAARDKQPVLATALRSLPGLLIAVAIFALLGGVLLGAASAHAGASMREAGKVALDKYFWIFLDWGEAQKFTFWPQGGAGPVFWRAPFVYHVGPAPVIGALLAVPVAVALVLRRLRWTAGDITLLAFMAVSAAWAGLLMLGPEGHLGGFLYQFAPYNWFRHAIKWAVFHQTFLCVLGFFVVGRLLVLIPMPRVRTAAQTGVLVLTLAATVQFIAVTHNPQRLTGDTLPLPAPTFPADPSYRQVGVWPDGPTYETPMSSRLLGWDYASLWRVPAIAGYEPMVRLDNLKAAQGVWHPGYYQNIDTTDFGALARWGVRYLLSPAGIADRVVAGVSAQNPALAPKIVGADFGGATSVIELAGATPLMSVAGAPDAITHLRIDPHRVRADAQVRETGTLIINWVANPGLVVMIDGERVPTAADADNRITAQVGAGAHVVELVYRPAFLTPMIIGWLAAVALIALLLWKPPFLSPLQLRRKT